MFCNSLSICLFLSDADGNISVKFGRCIMNLSYVTKQHVYGSALLSYAVSGGFNEGADGWVSTYINILKQ
jgi:hypothetical protein